MIDNMADEQQFETANGWMVESGMDYAECYKVAELLKIRWQLTLP